MRAVEHDHSCTRDLFCLSSQWVWQLIGTRGAGLEVKQEQKVKARTDLGRFNNLQDLHTMQDTRKETSQDLKQQAEPQERAAGS